MAKFCEYCGRKTDGAVCGCPYSTGVSASGGGVSVPPPQAHITAPDGFTPDPNSGLYYRITPGNDENGQIGEWVTWFYPDTGKYVQQFTPDPNAPAPARAYASPPVSPIAKKKTPLLLVVMPFAGLITGAVAAIIKWI